MARRGAVRHRRGNTYLRGLGGAADVAAAVAAPKLLAADITSHAKGFAFLTTVAATNVLGQRVRVIHGWWTSHGAVVVQPRPLGLLRLRHAHRRRAQGTQARPRQGHQRHLVPAHRRPPNPSSCSARCCWPTPERPPRLRLIAAFALGLVLYLIVMTMVFLRWTFAELEPTEADPPAWIAAGCRRHHRARRLQPARSPRALTSGSNASPRSSKASSSSPGPPPPSGSRSWSPSASGATSSTGYRSATTPPTGPSSSPSACTAPPPTACAPPTSASGTARSATCSASTSGSRTATSPVCSPARAPTGAGPWSAPRRPATERPTSPRRCSELAGRARRQDVRRLGSGNVAIFAIEKLQQLGGKVVACSDSEGYVVDRPASTSISSRRSSWTIAAGSATTQIGGHELRHRRQDLGRAVRRCVPCATQNELTGRDARRSSQRRHRCGRGRQHALDPRCRRRPSCPQAWRSDPGKAANAGGVATSALEMQQNASRDSWTFEHTEQRLAQIMSGIHDAASDRRRVRRARQLRRRGQHRRLPSGQPGHAGARPHLSGNDRRPPGDGTTPSPLGIHRTRP
jgi:hypothetical protein